MSKVYTTSGDILPLDIIRDDGKYFFRKMFTTKRESHVEREIVTMLKANPLPGVVEIYEVKNTYYDMEMLDTERQICLTLEDCENIKKQLQDLGIMYIDWKYDNFGYANDGKVKIFDFDCSGVINKSNPDLWYISPFHAFSYRMAINNGCKTPLEIDNYAFINGIH